MTIKARRFTVQTGPGAWVVVNRAAGFHPRCVFSTSLTALPENQHDLTQWVFGLICRLWWDVTDSDGLAGAMKDAEEITARLVKARQEIGAHDDTHR